jgi:hypothetical protein
MSVDQPSGPEPTTPLPESNVRPVEPPPVPRGGHPPASPPVALGHRPVYVVQRPKSRSSAVLLAIFLSFFTWLYTYEKDSWKFWLNLAVAVVNIVLSVLTLGIWLLIALPVAFAAWMWAIIDVAVKPRRYYDMYPLV